MGITGGCSFTDLANGDAFTRHDFVLDRTQWICARNSINRNVEVVVRCVRPLDRTGEVKEGCECPELETPLDRLTYPEQVFAVPAQGVGGVGATCPTGSTLLGGGCTGGHETATGDAFLISGGILPDDPQTWYCSWHAPGNGSISSSATAICLNAPGPDAVTGAPVAPEVFEHVFVQETLAANNTRIVDATCDPGDTLIAGGCHVEDADVAFADLRLTRSTLLPPQDNRPNTWHCAWGNPTNATPRVVATATCLKPAGTVSQLQ